MTDDRRGGKGSAVLSGNGGRAAARPGPQPDPRAGQASHLTLVHSRPAKEASWLLPASLGQLADASSGVQRKGRPGRRPRALLIVDSLPHAGGDEAGGLVLACALRRLGHEVTMAPADGELDRSWDQPLESDLSEHGIFSLGRPRHRSIEEALYEHAGSFDVVCLMGAALTRIYEPLVRLHEPEARVLCCLPGLDHPALLNQAGHDKRRLRAARAVQRQEVLAAYVSDATIIAHTADAWALEAALPSLPVHVAPWLGAPCDSRPEDPAQAALDETLQRALGVTLRSRQTLP